MSDDNSPNTQIVTAAILVIGDEILSGRTKDKNVGYIADHLTAIGIQLSEVRIVPDTEKEIVEAVNALRSKYDYLFTTGGIGPTHDDITADCIAKAFGVPIDLDPRAVKILSEYYQEQEFTEARQRMARIPAGADLIENIVSKAPGFKLENVIVMAGVPRIMQVMLDAITPRLNTGKKMLSESIQLRCPEGDAAPVLAKVQEQYSDVSMGSYPFLDKGKLGVNLVLRSFDDERLKQANKTLQEALKEQGLLEKE